MSTSRPSTHTKRFYIGSVAREYLTDSDGQMRLLSGLGNIFVIAVESRFSKWTWLIAIEKDDDTQETPRIIIKRKIRSDRNIFARQSTKQLVYGFQTTGNPCREEATWQIEIIELDTPHLKADDDEQNIAFHRLYPGFGVTLGRDVDFAIHDGYFYAVSTRLAAKLVDGDWTSFYDCMWMPLSTLIDSSRDTITTPQDVRWELTQIHRRCGSEGPINDAWTTLRMEPDQSTNQLMIVETRREWVNGSSRQICSCYVQPLLRPAESPSSQPLSESSRDHDDRVNSRISTNAVDYSHSFLHHNTALANTTQTLGITSTKCHSYNLSGKSFLDLTESNGTLYLQVSPAANIPTPRCESVRAGITAQGRREDLIFHSKAVAPRLFLIASSRSLQEIAVAHKSMDGSGRGQIEGAGSRVFEEFTAASDERCVVFMCGSRGDENKPIVLVSFDPMI